MTAAPWTSAAPTIASPRRWQVAASLWAIPALAVWLQAVVWPESLTLLRSWLAGDPTLLLSLLLIAGSELLALLVVIFQVGSRGISLRRFALPPLVVAALPAVLCFWDIRNEALLAGEQTALATRHLFALGALLYAGSALLTLRGLVEAEPDPLPDAVEA